MGIDLDKAGELYPGHVVSLGVSPVDNYRHAWTASYQARLRVKPSLLADGWSVFGTAEGEIKALSIADHNRTPNAEECERLRKLWATIDWAPLAAYVAEERSRVAKVNDALKAAHLAALRAWDPFTQPHPDLVLEDPVPWEATVVLPAPAVEPTEEPKAERPKRPRTPVEFALSPMLGERTTFRSDGLPLQLIVTTRLWVVPSRGKRFKLNATIAVDEEREKVVNLWASDCANEAILADFNAWKGSLTAADLLPGIDLRKAYSVWATRVRETRAVHIRKAERGIANRNFDYPSGWLQNLSV